VEAEVDADAAQDEEVRSLFEEVLQDKVALVRATA
jgi:hypothetical protein